MGTFDLQPLPLLDVARLSPRHHESQGDHEPGTVGYPSKGGQQPTPFPHRRGRKEAPRPYYEKVAFASAGTLDRDSHRAAQRQPIRIDVGHGRLEVPRASHSTYQE